MPLTNVEIKNAKPRAKSHKLWDGGSLYVEVMTTGSKLWRWKYHFKKSENRFSIGPYPEVSIKQAREARDDARALLRSGIDPNAHKKAKKPPKWRTVMALLRLLLWSGMLDRVEYGVRFIAKT